MKTLLTLLLVLIIANTSYSQELKNELITLMNEINRFEKSVPYFTKSKVTLFLKCDSDKYYNAFYGIYINDNLVKTGQLTKDTFPLNWQNFIGDYPVYGGTNIIKVRIFKDGADVAKKFEIDIPEYRRVAIELFITNTPEKPKVITQAWVLE
jgi:hypothetical protein